MKFSSSRFLIFLVVAILFIAQSVAAQVVEIPDPNLEQALREALELPDGVSITQQEMLKLQRLNDGSERNIADLTGLQHATNLANLTLWGNPISDITPLSNLTNLVYLDVAGCQVVDISPIAGLINLQKLNLRFNHIVDITPLTNLTQLQELRINNNQIRDITPLSNLIKLQRLDIHRNQIVDITPLVNLKKLKELRINDNQIRNHTPLEALSLTILEYDEPCVLPALPIGQRIQNRTFPSVFSPWTGAHVKNLPELSKTERLALHDLHWHAPYFGLRIFETYQGWRLTGKLEAAQAIRDELLAFNPNMIFITGMPWRDAYPDYYPEDFPYWLRGPDGNRVPTPSGKKFLLDFTQLGMQDIIVEQTVAIAKCGLFDGRFFDWFAEHFAVLQGYYSYEEEQQAKDKILQRIRDAVRDDFLIIINSNRSTMRRRAWGINGTFMETLRDNDGGYTHEGIKEIEDTLTWSEENLRSPQINCLEGWGIPNEPPDSPNNLRWMRVFTTMSLTLSDGYVLYGMEDSHQHIWYDFWNADLGRPIGAINQQYQDINGLFIREFTNGWAVYNRSGQVQTITLPRVSTGVSSNKQDITHLLPDLDGEIYLRKGKPFDLNRDGTVNVLDLIIIAQSFGSTQGDINGNGTTDILDLTLVAQQFRK